MTQSQTVKRVTVNSNSALKVERPEGYTGKHSAQFNSLVINLAIHPDSTLCTKNGTQECFYSVPGTKNIKRINSKHVSELVPGKDKKQYISSVKNTKQEE